MLRMTDRLSAHHNHERFSQTCPHVNTNKKVTGLVAGITASIISLVMKQVELKGVSASGPVSA